MQPASSSDDDSDSDDDDSGIGSTERSGPAAAEFDDLPSEDSCLDDDSDDDSSSSCASSDSDPDSDADEDENDTPYRVQDRDVESSLAHRLDYDRNRGIVRNSDAVTKKKEALATARRRLRELKEKKRKKEDKKVEDEASSSFLLADEDDDDGGGSEPDEPSEEESKTEKKKKKKKSRHGPTTASSLRSAYFSRGAPDLNSSGVGTTVGANRYKPRDPRMEGSTLATTSFANDMDVFERRYEFLEEMRDKDIADLKQRCKAWNTKGKAGTKKRRRMGLTDGASTMEDDLALLEKLVSERSTQKVDRERRNAKRAVNRKMKTQVAEGKRGAYYLKKRDRKQMEVEARFEEIKAKGGEDALNKVLAKKRKKKRSKDAGLMPRDLPFNR